MVGRVSSMSVLIDRYRVVVSVFFWLNFPEAALRRVLREAGFAEVAAPLPSVSIAPGVELSVGGPKRVLASFKSVRVSWDSVKFVLSFEGVAGDVAEGLRAFRDAFERLGYSLRDVCHYYEFSFDPQPVDVDGFVEGLRSRVDLSLDVGEELKPFSISFSNYDRPVSRECFYKWFHLSVEPDVNAPNRRVVLRIVKRDVDFEDVLKFIDGLDELIERVKASFNRGR